MNRLTFFLFLVWAITKNSGIKTYNVALGSENLIVLVVSELQEKGYYTQNPEHNEMTSQQEIV